MHLSQLLLQIDVLMLRPEAVLQRSLLPLDRGHFSRGELCAVVMPALGKQPVVFVELGFRVVEVGGVVSLLATTFAASAFVIDELLELRLHNQFLIAGKCGTERYLLLPLSLGIALLGNGEHCG